MYTALQHCTFHKSARFPHHCLRIPFHNYPLAPLCPCSAQFLSGDYLFNPLTTALETEEILPKNEELFFYQGPLDMYTSIWKPGNTGRWDTGNHWEAHKSVPEGQKSWPHKPYEAQESHVPSILDLVYWTNQTIP